MSETPRTEGLPLRQYASSHVRAVTERARGQVKRWSPASGAAELVEESGAGAAQVLLAALLDGEVVPAEFEMEPWAMVLRHIGNYRSPDASTVVSGGTPLDLRRDGNAYWARSWAARALAYIGDDRSAPSLVRALSDDHWRVRMTAAQTIGRLRLQGRSAELHPLLEDDHGRVRDAAALALERTGYRDA